MTPGHTGESPRFGPTPGAATRRQTGALLRTQYRSVFRAMVIAGFLSYASYLVLFSALGVPLMPLVNAGAMALCALGYWAVSKDRLHIATAVMGVVVVGHGVPATWVLGWSANFHLFTFLFLVFALLSPELARLTKVAIVSTITSSYLVLDSVLHGHVPLTPESTTTLFKVLNIVMFGGTMSYLAFIHSETLWSTTDQLNRLNGRLTRLATTDALTGLLNRRSMRDALDEHLARLDESGEPFSVIMSDIDDFKSINDRYGHAIGDIALTSTASALHGSLRPTDCVGRWGGEEFLALLPGADAATAAAVAARLHERVRSTQIRIDGASFPVRMTFGVATARAGQTAEELLAAADAALYDGKRAGKDRVTIAG